MLKAVPSKKTGRKKKDVLHCRRYDGVTVASSLEKIRVGVVSTAKPTPCLGLASGDQERFIIRFIHSESKRMTVQLDGRCSANLSHACGTICSRWREVLVRCRPAARKAMQRAAKKSLRLAALRRASTCGCRSAFSADRRAQNSVFYRWLGHAVMPAAHYFQKRLPGDKKNRRGKTIKCRAREASPLYVTLY